MNVLFSVSLWLALIMSSCYGNAGSHEKSTDSYDDYTGVTPTPAYDDDYDYNATFDYYYVTMAHNTTNNVVGKEVSEVMITQKEIPDSKVYNRTNEVSGIGQSILVLSLGMAVLQLWN